MDAHAGRDISVVVRVLLLGLVVCAYAVVAVQGQACVPFRGSPATRFKCDSVVTYPNVLLLPGQSYEQADKTTSETTKLLGAFVPPVCRSAAIRLACFGGFPECSVVPAFSYKAPCRSVCEEAVAACNEFFTAQNRSYLLPNCSSPLFPVTNCNDGSQAPAVVPYSQADCPYPLKYNSKGTIADPTKTLGSPEQICAYPCPDPMFTSEEWDASFGILFSLAMISFAMVLFLIITYSLMRHKRRFPTSFQIWLSVSSLVCSIGVLLPVFVGGPRRTFCTWDEVPVLQTFEGARDNNGQGVVCVLQAMLTMFGGLAGSCWWLMLTVSGFLFIVLKVRNRKIIRLLSIVSHLVGWGVPGLCVFIGLVAQKMSGRPFNCFAEGPWDWGIWFAPVIFNLTVGTTLMVVVIIKVWRVKSRLKEVSQTVISTEHLIRLSGLIVGYWFIYVYFTCYRAYSESVTSELEDAVADQIACGVATGEQCPLEKTFNKGMWMLQALTLGGQGIIIFCSLGLSKEPFIFWRLLLRNWRHPMSIIAAGASSKGVSEGTMSAGKDSKSTSLAHDASLTDDGGDL